MRIHQRTYEETKRIYERYLHLKIVDGLKPWQISERLGLSRYALQSIQQRCKDDKTIKIPMRMEII